MPHQQPSAVDVPPSCFDSITCSRGHRSGLLARDHAACCALVACLCVIQASPGPTHWHCTRTYIVLLRPQTGHSPSLRSRLAPPCRSSVLSTDACACPAFCRPLWRLRCRPTLWRPPGSAAKTRARCHNTYQHSTMHESGVAGALPPDADRRVLSNLLHWNKEYSCRCSIARGFHIWRL
jgi:hypothetical protein